MRRLWFHFPTDTGRWAALIERHMERCKSYRVGRGVIWFYEEEADEARTKGGSPC